MANAIRKLVTYGGDTSLMDPEGYSPLHYAVHQRHGEAIEALLLVGADVNQIDHDTWSALHHAANDGYLPEAMALCNMQVEGDKRSGRVTGRGGRP